MSECQVIKVKGSNSNPIVLNFGEPGQVTKATSTKNYFREQEKIIFRLRHSSHRFVLQDLHPAFLQKFLNQKRNSSGIPPAPTGRWLG